MAGLNRVSLIGRVGKDPEIRSTQAGRRIANFSVATSESWTDKQSGERKENTQWHNVVCFNEALAGVIEKYVHKGDQIFVEGALETRKWQDKDGNDRYSTEVVLKAFGGQVVLLGNKRDGDASSDASGGSPASRDAGSSAKSDSRGWDSGKQAGNDLDDDIPF